MPCFSSKTCASLQCLVINGFHLRKLRFGKNHSFIQKAKPIQDHGIYPISHRNAKYLFPISDQNGSAFFGSTQLKGLYKGVLPGEGYNTREN